MKKIQYSVFKKETGNAGGKAKNDCSTILENMGFVNSYHPSSKRFVRIVQQIFSFLKFNKTDIVIIQYPAISQQIFKLFIKKIKNNKNTILIVHDLLSLQTKAVTISDEIERLNYFSYVIAHNRTMKSFLLDNGYKGNIEVLDIFDYLHDNSKSVLSHDFSRSVVFAGNLSKAGFIEDLDKVNNVVFLLYGKKNNELSAKSNVNYKGMLNSDEIVYKLDGDYGLIWDGDSISTCEGTSGEYLLYNNPHKLSLYIAANKPVIVWKKAAISEFVINNKIGIAIDSLEDLNNIDLAENYDEYKSNVRDIKNKISDGYYLKKSVNSILKIIDEKDSDERIRL